VLLLVGQLTYLQVYDADRLANDPRNIRFQLRDFSKPRGKIQTSDGQVLARSVETKDELKFQRLYPQGALFSQLVGYQSFVFGNTGIEQTYNNELAGRDPLLQIRNVGDLLAGKEPVGNVVLSLSSSLQSAARDALGGQRRAARRPLVQHGAGARRGAARELVRALGRPRERVLDRLAAGRALGRGDHRYVAVAAAREQRGDQRDDDHGGEQRESAHPL
jgi:cell division protein FtsI/penicillin-binding protein 2